MGAMVCSVCGRRAEVVDKEDVKDESGHTVSIRFTMRFPCGHTSDKYRVQRLNDGRRNTHRF